MTDRLPSETWTQIFFFACTDGGVTGCSLSLVSHYFRAAVLPVQLHSVALTSTSKIESFEDLLKHRQPEHRKVRHLFLSLAGNQAEGRLTSTSYTYNEAFRRVLTTVAPDLLTLTSTLLRDYSQDSIITTCFPSLVELTVHGYVRYADDAAEAMFTGHFPALRRLHLLSTPNSCPLYLKRAPTLTHLRLSTMAHIDSSLRTAITAFLRDSTSPDASPFPPTLRRIVIEPYAHRIIRFTGNDTASWLSNVMRQALLEMDRENKLVILNDSSSRGTVASPPPSNARKAWESRLAGGSGCWVGNPDNSRRIGPSELRSRGLWEGLQAVPGPLLYQL